jgi:glycosyltransferase involved in cell wall biosynthesis
MKQKILWITNIPTQNFVELTNLKSNGLWIDTLIPFFEKSQEFDIAIATIGKTKKILRKKISRVEYYLLPGDNSFHYKRSNKKSLKDWEEVFNSFQPNIVMIWGTECLHSRNAVKISLLNKIPFVVFVQGILSTIYKQKFGKVNLLTRIKSFSVRDFIKLSFSPFTNFDEIKKVKNEAYILNNSNGIIVENNWSKNTIVDILSDKFKVFYNLNLPVNNLFMNSKSSFNSNFNELKIFSISISNPSKGPHILIKAANTLTIRKIPFHIYFTGKDPHRLIFYRRTWFQNYIIKLIKEFDLGNNISFTGEVPQNELLKLLTSSSIFVSPSFVENHSSSIKEAMLLGLPVLTTDVGGIKEYFTNNKNGYFFETNNEKDLSEKIIFLFDHRDKLMEFSNESKKYKVNNEEIFKYLVDIYSKIDKNKQINSKV